MIISYKLQYDSSMSVLRKCGSSKLKRTRKHHGAGARRRCLKLHSGAYGTGAKARHNAMQGSKERVGTTPV